MGASVNKEIAGALLPPPPRDRGVTMHERQAFVDGLYAFLDYTEPDNLRNNIKEGLMVRRYAQDKEKEFEKRCIQRWAISELAKAIAEDPDNPVEDVAYRFALKLYGYACTSFDAKMRNVFGIAAEFIDKEVIGLFRTEDGVYP